MELLQLRAPIPWAHQYKKSTHYLDGKLLVNERAGASVQIESVQATKVLQQATPVETGFEAGDTLAVYDVQVGDRMRAVHGTAMRAVEGASGTYVLEATAPVWITLPAAVSETRAVEVYDAASDTWHSVDDAGGRFLLAPATGPDAAVTWRLTAP